MSNIFSLLGGKPDSAPCPVCGKPRIVLTGNCYTGWECEVGHYNVRMTDTAGNPLESTHEMPYFMPVFEAKEQP